MKKHSAGFTLLELLVVVAIIGLMTAVVAINSSGARSQSRDAKRKTDASLVAGALQIYVSEQHSYPLAPTGAWTTQLKSVLYPTYLSQWPTDPINSTADGTTIGSNNGFTYQTNKKDQPTLGLPAGSLYVIDVTLEGKDTPTLAGTDVDCVNPAVQAFYVTGVFLCSADQKYHDRITSR